MPLMGCLCGRERILMQNAELVLGVLIDFIGITVTVMKRIFSCSYSLHCITLDLFYEYIRRITESTTNL